jgi:ABC-2 type transport system permease protein
MTALVHAELLKLRTTRLWVVLLIVGALLAGASAALLLAIAGSVQNGTPVPDIRTVADIRSLVHGSADLLVTLALVLGATMSTAEFRYGTAGITYLAEPRRMRVVTAKVLASIPVGALFGSVGAILPLIVAAVWFAAEGKSLPFDASVIGAVGGVMAKAAFAAAFGAAVGAALRGQVAAIVGLLVFQLIAEPLVGVLLPSVARWLPFSGAAAAFSSSRSELFSRPQAAVLMLAYVVAWWGFAAWLERRRDV